MADDAHARQADVQKTNESVLGISLFHAFARTIRFVAELAGPVISVERGIVSAPVANGVVYADMTGLKMDVMPMTIYNDIQLLRDLGRMKEGSTAIIRYDADNETYHADNGQMELMIGRKASGPVYAALTALTPVGFPALDFQPSTLRRHIGKAARGFLSLYDGQLEQITPDGKGPLSFNHDGAFTRRGRTPDIKLSVSKVFKALKLNLGEMTLRVGKDGDDYYVEFISEVTHLVNLHLQEKAEIL